MDYSIHKQTYAELELKYDKSSKTFRKYFDQLGHAPFPSPIDCRPQVNLIFDTTFFGRFFGVMVFRAPGINLYWEFVESEKISNYKVSLEKLKEEYEILSCTIDGRKGAIKMLKELFSNLPIQLCIYHQVAIIRRYTTLRPKTECGKELWKLAQELKALPEKEFRDKLIKFENKFKDFFKEKNESGRWKHGRLRSAIRSLKVNLEYLFTHQNYPELNIPNTTNSCEGSFVHWKSKVKFHRGISTERRKQMISQFLS